MRRILFGLCPNVVNARFKIQCVKTNGWIWLRRIKEKRNQNKNKTRWEANDYLYLDETERKKK